MASQHPSAQSAPKSPRATVLALAAFVSTSVILGSAWALTSAVGVMHGAARTLSEGMTVAQPQASRHVASREPRLPRPVRAAKAERIVKPSESELRRRQLTADAIRSAHKRQLAIQVASADKRKKAVQAENAAAFARAKRLMEREETLGGQQTLLTALVEDVPTRSLQPFGLVLAKPDAEDEDVVALPSQIPLPEARPLIEKAATETVDDTDDAALADKADDKTGDKSGDKRAVARRDRDGKADDKSLAYAKPSLFGDLFKRSAKDGGWPGKGTKVAIYDVSNATVYMPDGTKLRAHSGIGHMRDNPRYEHVKMSGPTPAGIYRLTMREKRFYGVEAIRMTSIDGRDPKNRTGLLTHTNLLRGRTGSHGCVAFQNYQPFLRAFKRGQIEMMIVVPELPSSRTQLAALYRKAGA
jgi:hypothetical protein